MATARPKPIAESQPTDSVPPALAIAASYSWRILLVVGALVVVGFLIVQLRYVVVPVLVAILISALLLPAVQWLLRHRWPRWLAILTTMFGTIGVISGLVLVVVWQVRLGFPDLQDKSIAAFERFKEFLLVSPLQLTEADINGYVSEILATLQRDSSVLVSGILSAGSTVGHVIAGMLIAIFATIFILIDGKAIFAWVVRLFPRRARAAVDGSGHAGWVTLETFVKVQIFVAAVDATGIGLGAWILGLFFGGFPLVVPIAVAVFFGSFVPVVGALLTGALAVFVALVYLGPFPALIMLGIVLLVQQVEGHILQPLVMGTAVKVHPLAVVLAVAAGGYTAGIAGALFAVPLVAVTNVVVNYIASGQWRTNLHPTAEDLLTDG